MSVPPDQLMKLMGSKKSLGPAAAPIPMPPVEDSTSMGDSSTAPMASPMSTPEPKMGNREGALVNLGMALDLIEQALPALGSESPEGQKVRAALNSLSTVLGPKKGKTNELQQSEILQMLQALPNAGGSNPQSMALQNAPAIPNMPPIPGAAPGGAPPTPPQASPL